MNIQSLENQGTRKPPAPILWRAAIIGAILIAAAFAVIYHFENKLDLVKIAGSSLTLDAEVMNVDPALQARLVSATGKLNSNQLLGDGILIKAGRNILLERKVEMYSWIETKGKKNKGKGVSEEAANGYLYKKEWREKPVSSEEFKYPNGHQNPKKKLENLSCQVKEVKVGQYEIDPTMVKFPQLDNLSLSKQIVATQEGAKLVSKKYVFAGEGTIKSPQIGDLRISYRSLAEGSQVTVLGKLTVNAIVPYLDEKGNSLYHMYHGERKDALRDFGRENRGSRWLIDLLAFLMLWGGIYLILESNLPGLILKKPLNSLMSRASKNTWKMNM